MAERSRGQPAVLAIFYELSSLTSRTAAVPKAVNSPRVAPGEVHLVHLPPGGGPLKGMNTVPGQNTFEKIRRYGRRTKKIPPNRAL